MSKTTRSLYGCNICNYVAFHPLQYCPKCPGKLKPIELPWDYDKYPLGYFTGNNAEKKLNDWFLKNNKITDGR